MYLKKEETQRPEVDLEELLHGLGDTAYRCPKCGEAKLQWQGEIQGTMGGQLYRRQMPPMARARRALGAAKQPAKQNIRPPPATKIG